MTGEVTQFKLSDKVVVTLRAKRDVINRLEDQLAQYVQGVADGAGLSGDWTLNEGAGTLDKVSK